MSPVRGRGRDTVLLHSMNSNGGHTANIRIAATFDYDLPLTG